MRLCLLTSQTIAQLSLEPQWSHQGITPGPCPEDLMLCPPNPGWVVSKPLCSVGWLTSVFYLQAGVWKRSDTSWAKDPFPPLPSMVATCLPFPSSPG